jgi:hypothetical protein
VSWIDISPTCVSNKLDHDLLIKAPQPALGMVQGASEQRDELDPLVDILQGSLDEDTAFYLIDAQAPLMD